MYEIKSEYALVLSVRPARFARAISCMSCRRHNSLDHGRCVPHLGIEPRSAAPQAAMLSVTPAGQKNMPGRARTDDSRFKRPVLYQLNYRHLWTRCDSAHHVRASHVMQDAANNLVWVCTRGLPSHTIASTTSLFTWICTRSSRGYSPACSHYTMKRSSVTAQIRIGSSCATSKRAAD